MKRLTFLMALLLVVALLAMTACTDKTEQGSDTGTQSGTATDSRAEDSSDPSGTTSILDTTDAPDTTVSPETDLPADSDDLAAQYRAALAKTQGLDSVEAEVVLLTSMTIEGETMEMPIGYVIKAVGLTGESPVLRAAMSFSMMGETYTGDLYTKDGWNYYTLEEGNYKIPVETDSENLEELLTLSGLTDDMLAGATVTTEDSLTVLEIALTTEQLDEFYGLEEEMIDPAEIDQATVRVVIDGNGYVTEQKLAFAQEADGVTSTFSYTVTLRNPGTAVTVEAPEGYESYESYEEDDLFVE